MSSATTAQLHTPAVLEARLAALGIPVARLLEAARIARSTWSDWRACRTRPRPDRWSATTAAFDALVAEATPAPADVEPEEAGAEPVTLTGSSAPSGAPPSFTPITTAAPAGDLGAECPSASAGQAPDLDAAVILAADHAAALGRREMRTLYRYAHASDLCSDIPGRRSEIGETAAHRLHMRAHRRLKRAVRATAALQAGTPAGVAAKARAVLAVHNATDEDAWWAALRDSTIQDAARLVAQEADAAAEEGEPIIATLGRVADLCAFASSETGSEAERDAACATMSGLVKEAAAMPIMTRAGALAALAYVRDDFAFTHIEAHKDPHWSDVVALRLLDNALAALRRTAMPQHGRRTASPAPRGSFAADLSTLAALTAESDRLSRLALECSERTSWAEPPEALFFHTGDALGFQSLLSRQAGGRSWYPPTAVEALRAKSFERAFVDPDGRDQRRRDEIVAAYDAWRADRDAACEASGLMAVEGERDACASLMCEMRDVLLDRPARTLDDLLAKAAVFGWWYVDENESAASTIEADRARMLAQRKGDTPLAMALGILVDLVAMAEARGLTIACLAEQAGAATPEAPIARAAA